MIFNPTRSLYIIGLIFVSVILCYTPHFYGHRLLWTFSPEINATRLVLHFPQDRDQVENISNYVNEVIAPTVCMVMVTVCTKITVSQVNSSSKWRKSLATPGPSAHPPSSSNAMGETSFKDPGLPDKTQQSSHDNSVSTVSKREVKKSVVPATKANAQSLQKVRKVTRMVMLICTIFLICNTPCILIIYLRFIVPEIASMGRYHNLFMAIYSIDFFLETINSSINIVVYYRMSSRFKLEFNRLFGIGDEGVSTSRSTPKYKT